MKKLKLLIALVPLVITAAVLPLFPERVPMHYNIEGNVDRMGSRYELLLMPLIILLVVAVSSFATKHYVKRAECADESEAKTAKANTKVLGITSLAVPVVFGALQCGILYMTYRNATAQNIEVKSDLIVRLTFILIGLMCVVMGNFMPKAPRNNLFGFRVTWSMYNDNTWKKCNRMGGIFFVMIGLLMIVTSALVPVTLVAILSLVYLFGATIILLIYSYKVYKEEKASESAQK